MKSLNSFSSFIAEARANNELNHAEVLDLHPASMSGEQRLLCAILTRALLDAMQPTPLLLNEIGRRKERKREESLEFFMSDSIAPFSCRWICEHLSADPQGLRERLVAILSTDNRDELFCKMFPKMRATKLFLSRFH